MKTILPALISTLLLCISTFSYADIYAGGALGWGDFDYDDIDKGFARKAYIGYHVDGTRFAGELAYLDSGDADIDGVSSALRVSGFNASFVYNTETDPGTTSPINFAFKAGLYRLTSDLDSSRGSAVRSDSASSMGLSLGAGIDYFVAENAAVTFGLDRLINVKDFADDESITFIMVGAKYYF